MRHFYTAIIVMTLVGCGREKPMAKENRSVMDSPGVGLRKMALTTSPTQLGFSPDSDFPKVYGIITDWNLGDQTASIMSMRDGTASLYTTSTFGIIGGQGDEKVRQAVERYVKAAELYFESGKVVSDFAYPGKGQVYFYLLTYDGIRLCVGNEARINRNTDPTRPLFAAAQDVLTALRMITENRNSQPTSPGDRLKAPPEK